MQPHEDVPFCVTGMDTAVFEAWTRGKMKDRPRAHDLIHANRLTALRSIVHKRPLLTVDGLVEEGKALDMSERLRCQKTSVQLHDFTNAAQMKKMVSQVKDELEVLKEKDKVSQSEEVPEVDIDSFVRRKLGHHAEPLKSNLLGSSPLSETRVGPSLSTKLNFILSEVSTHVTQRHFISSSLLGSGAFIEGKVPRILQFATHYCPYRGGALFDGDKVPPIYNRCVSATARTMRHDV